MKSDKALSNAELELTQRIQLHFPRGAIEPRTLHAWTSCPTELLTKKLTACFRTDPSSKVKGSSVIVCLNRRDRQDYNEDITKVMHRELESAGPRSYDLTKVRRWRHPAQTDDVGPPGTFIYQVLKGMQTLDTCLGLNDGRAIQGLDLKLFAELFGDTTPYLWRSVVKYRNDPEISVPYLYVEGGDIVIGWRGISEQFKSDDYALMYPD